MKRVWVGVFLLALSISLCVWEQIEIDSFCKQVDTLCDSGNMEAAKEIKALWDEKNDVLYAFSQHDLLEHLAEGIEQIDTKEEKDIEEALNEIKAQTEVYYENHRITISNIF